MVRERILQSLSRPAKGLWHDWLDVRGGSGVAARKERDVVTARRQLPTEPVDDPFRSPIASRRNGFVERSKLSDAHEPFSFRDVELRRVRASGIPRSGSCHGFPS
jgi:hypothetical protein